MSRVDAVDASSLPGGEDGNVKKFIPANIDDSPVHV
jgi:hypothetical protein